MEEYHKIITMYERDPENLKRVIEGNWATPELKHLWSLGWIWTEKVDGTNIRIHWDNRDMRIGGKTADAQIPVFLYDRLNELFTGEKLDECFPNDKEHSIGEFVPDGSDDITLYGEGYGAKIQKGGGNYKADGVDFVLFDVSINGLWLERHNVSDIAHKLGISAVPEVGRGTLAEAATMTKAGFNSQWGDFVAEGLVCRPVIDLLDRRGQRIIAKIKAKDFSR